MLKFNENGKFGMLLFGDLHEKEDYLTSPKFRDMQKLMKAAVDKYKPDLCVLLGDNFDTGLCKRDPALYEQGLRDMLKPALEKNIPVAFIMGNHEHDADCDKEIIEACNRIEGIIIRPDGAGGKADFYEPVYSRDGKKPLACLWFLDSNNLYEDRNLSHYDYVHTDQLEWFEKENGRITEENCGVPLPSYIFQHIPVPEEYELLRKAKIWEYPVSVKGYGTRSNVRYVGAKGTVGYVGEGPCAPDINNGQFDVWQKAGNVKAAFFGHDHLNDFSGYARGIFLAQHKTAGFRAYTDGCRSCVRYVELDENAPADFYQELKRFKEFGLRSESLGPIFRTITDRQSMALHFCARALGAAAALTAAAYTVYYLTAGGKTNVKK